MKHFLMFLDGSEDLSQALVGEYDLRLVALSIMVASIAGYAALLISDRIASSGVRRTRIIWLTAGALAMGCGIWTMHFVGMLAFQLPVTVGYSPLLTLLSVVPGVAGAAVALGSMSRESVGFARLNLSGLVMGSGIGAMHYTGMAAMVMSASMKYSLPLFALSILVAHVLATFSLYVKFVLARNRNWSSAHGKGIAGLIMGCAVAGMHYTAMVAAVYFPGDGGARPDLVLAPLTLGLAAAFGTTVVLATAILATIVDQRMQGISEALLASETRHRLILETAGEGILSTDEKGLVVSFNSAAAKIFGYSVEDVVGSNVSMLIPEETARNHDEFIARYLVDGTSNVVGATRELDARRSDGTPFPISLTVSECEVLGQRAFSGIFRDLSEKRGLEAQLLQAQKLESIGQLAAGVAHEINTPAQYVGDNIEFLSESLGELMGVFKKFDGLLQAAVSSGVLEEVVAEVREALEAADFEFLEEEVPRALGQSSEGIKRVTKIVTAMKEFSHPGAHEKMPVQINRAIESTLTVASNEWKYVAEVETDLEQSLTPVACFAAEFNQVILNLVVNAAHAIDGQDREASEKGKITIRTRRDGDWVQIEISDDGPGIPKEVCSRIFDPFFTTKEVGKGTGQGLAIARSAIVDKHGGTIEVESEPGSGTTFRIRLPIGAESPCEAEA